MFQCKQFSIDDSQCAMKVTTDSLLFGSWVDLQTSESVLDVGCGSGLLMLMALQKTPASTGVHGIEIASEAAQQARHNLAASKWAIRAKVFSDDFFSMKPDQIYSHIVCNPPYFASSKGYAATHINSQSRWQARQQGEFTPRAFFAKAAELVQQDGMVSLVFPFELTESLKQAADQAGFYSVRETSVQSTPNKPAYLTLITFSRQRLSSRERVIDAPVIIREQGGEYTKEFRALCKDFYLHF